MSRTMNTDTFEALQTGGFDSKQATAIATAIPDLEPLRHELLGEMDRRFNAMDHKMDVRFEQVNTRFAEIDARIHRQTNVTIYAALGIVGTLIAVAKDFWGLF